MSLTFNNRIALVTGAGRGIGKAIADLLAKNGVTVICVSKSADSCGATAAATPLRYSLRRARSGPDKPLTRH